MDTQKFAGAANQAKEAASHLKESAIEGFNALRDTIKQKKVDGNIKDKLSHVAQEGMAAASKLGNIVSENIHLGAHNAGK